MTPTQIILVMLLSAHAAPPEISLHNANTSLEPSVVRNWTLICEDLCSLNLSGPSCGLDCAKIPVSEDLKSAARSISILAEEEKDEFCETLCKNGLGENECQCKVPIVAASLHHPHLPAGFKPDRLKICTNICRYQHVTLKSCPKCIFEEHRGHERFFMPFEPTQVQLPPLPPPPQQAMPLLHPPPSIALSQDNEEKWRLSKPTVFRPNAQLFQAVPFIQTTTDSTTPDWNRLCLQLCRNGTGGILCNCDLPPF